MNKCTTIVSIGINVILIGAIVYLGIVLQSTNSKVASLFQVYNTQRQAIETKDDQLRELQDKARRLEEIHTVPRSSTSPAYTFPAWDDIENISVDNDTANDTWQTNLFVPDTSFESRTLMFGHEDYPKISYTDNCTENEGCVFDSLHADAPPDSYVWYEYETVKFKIPYNQTWGNDGLAVATYIEVPGTEITWKDVAVQLTFGGPYVSGEGDLGWWPGKISMDIYTYDTIENFYEKLKTSEGVVSHVKKVNMQDGIVLQFDTAGLGTHKNLLYMSDNTIIELNTDESVVYDMLYDIIRTIQS